jgi:hypothetical protein
VSKFITLSKYPKARIEVGDTTITTNLREIIGLPDKIDSIEDLKDEQYIQGFCDAAEALILAMNKNVNWQSYPEALETLLDAIANNMDARTTPELKSYDDQDLDKTIEAEAHTDDRVHEVPFDAVHWFTQASDEDILALAKDGWGGDYSADQVAQWTEANGHIGLEALFGYLERVASTRKSCGFECHIVEADARPWLEKNRPEVFKQLPEEE